VTAALVRQTCQANLSKYNDVLDHRALHSLQVPSRQWPKVVRVSRGPRHRGRMGPDGDPLLVAFAVSLGEGASPKWSPSWGVYKGQRCDKYRDGPKSNFVAVR